MIFKQSRLFNKILLLFIILAIVPFLFFSYRVVSITTKYMQTDETLGHSHEAVRIHEEAMVKVINKLRHEIIIFVGYSLLLAIILSIIFARTIIKPRKELIKGTKIIDVQSGDEFRQLAASFNRMAESLRSREEEILQKNRELSALNSLAAIVSQSLDLDEILNKAMEKILEVNRMDGGGIFLLDDRREYLVCRSHKGVSEEFVGKLGKVKLGEDMPGIVALKMKPIIINDISSEPRTDSHTLNVLKKAEMKSYACIPIKRREEVQGVFCLFSKNQRPFLNTEIELLSSIGEMIGVAIENIRLYQMEKDIKSQLFEAVASERSKAESLLYGIADGVYSANIERQIISWNPSAEKITGFKAEEVIGKPCKEVLKHTDEEGHSLCESFCPFLSIVYKGERFSGEMYSNTSSGHRIPIHLSSGPVLDAKGTVIGSVSVFRDITHKKEIERMKTEFVRTVSHEFRAPLSAIVGMTEMLIDKEVNGSEKVEKYLKTIYDEGERLSRMVNEFLDIAMIESGKKVLKKQRINITDLFKECITSVSQNAARKDIKIKLLTQDRLFIDADREAMCQMILNLLTNSLTYSDNGTYVKLNAYPMEKRGENLIEITVEDTGWGISKKDLPHIFEKFYRSPLHQKKVKGTGLGLSLVQEIVNAYKGDIKVESRIGEGTKFTISLPVKA